MSQPYRNPQAEILDSLDAGAWKGERKRAIALEDLKSASGMPYQEEEPERCKFFADEPLYARTEHETIPGTNEEIAYWCHIEELWIQGAPSGEEYDNVNFLSGGSGLNLICRSCGHEIGRLIERMS